MSEQFYLSTLHKKKRRPGQRMKAKQRLAAQALFLATYERTANVLAAAQEAEIDRRLVYYWLEHDEQFGLAFGVADAAANVHIEAQIRRRAIEGVAEPMVSNGMIVYEWVPVLNAKGEPELDEKGKPKYTRGEMVMTRKYSDTLLMFYARRRMPEYREKSSLEVNAKVSATVQTSRRLSALSDEELDQLERIAAKAIEAEGRGGV